MTKKKRTSVEDALELVLTDLEADNPMTIGEIASKKNLSWVVIDRAVNLAMMIQDYLRVHKIEILGGSGRKIVLVEPRIDLTKLPAKTREWFIEEMFFKGEEKKQHTTEEAKRILGTKRKNETRTKLEVAIDCVLDALNLEDELSVLEMSKRIELNRRTIERVLGILTKFQDRLAQMKFMKIEGNIVLRRHPDLYSLDETRMVYLLKKLYLPHLAENLSEEKERSMLQMV